MSSCRSCVPPIRAHRPTLGQRKCLPSCPTNGFPTSAKFESNLSVRDLIWSEKSQIVVNLPVTTVPGCIGNNAKTLGLQYLQFLDMGACGCTPNGTRIVHHGTDELLIQQNTIPDGETASPAVLHILSACFYSLNCTPCNAHELYCHLWPARRYYIFHCHINCTIFGWGGGALLDIMCFDFLYSFLNETFLILRKLQGDTIINVRRSSCKVPVFLIVL
jgi:hypothetical protein